MPVLGPLSIESCWLSYFVIGTPFVHSGLPKRLQVPPCHLAGLFHSSVWHNGVGAGVNRKHQ